MNSQMKNSGIITVDITEDHRVNLRYCRGCGGLLVVVRDIDYGQQFCSTSCRDAYLDDFCEQELIEYLERMLD